MKVNLAKVMTARAALIAAGEPVTTINIRKHLGVGSYSTISNLLKKIDEEKKKKTIENTMSIRLDNELMQPLYESLRTTIGTVWAEIEEKLEKEHQAKREEIERQRQILEAQEANILKLIDEAEIKAAEEEKKRLKFEAATQAEIGRLQEKARTAEAKTQALQDENNELKTQHKQELKNQMSQFTTHLTQLTEALNEFRQLNHK